MRLENHLYATKNSEKNFTIAEIESAIKNQKQNTAPGLDLITPKMLTMAVGAKCLAILDLFNACLKISYFPNILKISIITPILKKSDSIKIEDLRPISLLPCL